MSKDGKKENELKLSYNILQNKLRNLKEYDTRYGTKILDSLGANIASVDDVLSKQLSGVSMSSCANNKHLANEVDTVTNIYSDLLSRIANNQSGCGQEDSLLDEGKDLSKFKRDFISLIGKNAKRKKRSASKSASKTPRRKYSKSASYTSMLTGNGAENLVMNAKRKRGSKKASKKTSKKASKKASKKLPRKMRSDNVIF